MQAIKARRTLSGDASRAYVVASCAAGMMRLPWDDRLDLNGNLDKVAHRLLVRLGWLGYDGGWYRGTLKDGTTVYVQARKQERLLVTPG